MDKTKKLSVPFSPELHKRFKLFCVANDKQMASAICELVEQTLDRAARQHEAKAAKAADRTEARA